MKKELKKGTFRWRKKFRYLPTRQQLAQELGVEWLANRLYTLLCRYLSLGNEIHMLRVKEWEFVYIIHMNSYGTTFEIIQKEPFTNTEII